MGIHISRREQSPVYPLEREKKVKKEKSLTASLHTLSERG